MKIPSVSSEKIRRNALLTREMRRDAWTMPAIVFGSGLAFCGFGLLADAVRRGLVGHWGVYVLYAALAVFGALLGLASLRGSARSAGGETYIPPPREQTAIVSPLEPPFPRTICPPVQAPDASVAVSIALSGSDPCRVIVRGPCRTGR